MTAAKKVLIIDSDMVRQSSMLWMSMELEPIMPCLWWMGSSGSWDIATNW